MAKYTLLLSILGLAALASAQCANPVSRPEIRSLSPEDRARFLSALNKIRENGELDRLSKLHVENADTIHGHPVFLAFHRVFVNDFAAALNKVDPGVPVPYWDWSLDATNPISSDLFTNNYMGGNGAGPQGCVSSGPFADWKMNIDSPHCLARKFNQGDSIAPFWPPEALLSMQKTCSQYGALSSGIENGCHGAVHLGISGDMSTMFAPNDPFFFLHHGMVDKLWYDWQMMEPNTRFQMYDNVNYNDPAVTPDDTIPGYPNMHVKDALDPRNGLCYVYVNSGSGEAAKRLMQEVDRQSALKNGGPTPPPQSMSAQPSPGGPSGLPNMPSPMSSAGQSPAGPSPAALAAAASAAGNGAPSADSAAQLNELTSQVSRLSGPGGDKASASAALHNQQVNFLQNVLLNSMTPNHGLDVASAFLNRHNRFLHRQVNALMRREQEETPGLGLPDILSGLASGLLGQDGVVGHLLQGLGHVVEVLPQGLGETLKAVGSIAEDVTNDVFDILKLPKIDMSKVPEKERRIPYVAELPEWWYKHNNLNATYAGQLRQQIHDMIDGFNGIDGYVSPATAHYLAKKYGSQH
ncbi:hypothetical protein LPJ63_002829 [Coemansia sp. RSA 2711]|nr:hypothetical protein LPJ63_002829 [Coemansia sp. RSA 2711]KAJ2370797.1 hypothetical protein H4S01_000001 [Coemansia sp. RSA 2610]